MEELQEHSCHELREHGSDGLGGEDGASVICGVGDGGEDDASVICGVGDGGEDGASAICGVGDGGEDGASAICGVGDDGEDGASAISLTCYLYNLHMHKYDTIINSNIDNYQLTICLYKSCAQLCLCPSPCLNEQSS